MFNKELTIIINKSNYVIIDCHLKLDKYILLQHAHLLFLLKQLNRVCNCLSNELAAIIIRVFININNIINNLDYCILLLKSLTDLHIQPPHISLMLTFSLN